jgi:hypothetical protein
MRFISGPLRGLLYQDRWNVHPSFSSYMNFHFFVFTVLLNGPFGNVKIHVLLYIDNIEDQVWPQEYIEFWECLVGETYEFMVTTYEPAALLCTSDGDRFSFIAAVNHAEFLTDQVTKNSVGQTDKRIVVRQQPPPPQKKIFCLLHGTQMADECEGEVGRPSWRPGYIVLQCNSLVVPHV